LSITKISKQTASILQAWISSLTYIYYLHVLSGIELESFCSIRGCQSWTIYYLTSSFLLLWILCAGRKLPA